MRVPEQPMLPISLGQDRRRHLGPILVNRVSRRYHVVRAARRACHLGQVVEAGHDEWLATTAHAEAEGYVPCCWCARRHRSVLQSVQVPRQCYPRASAPAARCDYRRLRRGR